VHEGALFRYSQRGMLGARWDEVAKTWLYDVQRVRQLFVHRDARLPAPPDGDLGRLGETRLAGAASGRRPDARAARQASQVGGGQPPLEGQRLTRAS
jgi:hypothetical protein